MAHAAVAIGQWPTRSTSVGFNNNPRSFAGPGGDISIVIIVVETRESLCEQCVQKATHLTEHFPATIEEESAMGHTKAYDSTAASLKKTVLASGELSNRTEPRIGWHADKGMARNSPVIEGKGVKRPS
jgi:hypothetical protein